MAYTGRTRIVECNRGGLTGAGSIDSLQPYMMVDTTRNILLEKNGRSKRGGTALVYAHAYSGTPYIMGIFRAIFANGNGYNLIATNDGKVYSGETVVLKSGLSTSNYFSFCFASVENKVFFTDGASAVQQWNGSAASSSAITGPATDWATTPVFQLLTHGKGVSERLWAINKLGVYCSKSWTTTGDLESFATGGEYIYILTPDGYGIVGAVEFGDRLFAFGKTKGFLIEDTDSSTSNWGYTALQWDGGVAHWRLIIKTPNDVVLMSEDGEIYSVTSVQSYGDYKRASLTRGSWMHDWIKANVDLTQIEKFHGVYDPTIRAIMIWVVRSGSTKVNAALVFFLDRPSVDESWMIFDNVNYTSGYSASASAIVTSSAGAVKTYTGDYWGEIWELHTTARNDWSNIINAQMRTVNDPFESPEVSKHFNELTVICAPQGNVPLSVKIWVDGNYKDTKTMTMSGGGAVMDTFVLDLDTLAGDEFIEISCKLGYRGKRIQYEFVQNGVDQSFFISSYRTDYKPLGVTQKEV